MHRVFQTASRSIDTSRFIAVVVGETDTDQRHIGVMHCEQDGQPYVLHLAWHCRLQNDAIAPEYFVIWVELGFEPKRLRQLAAYCRRVWKTNRSGGIPYAFSSPVKALDPATGAFLIGPTRFGLTCSSFVLALFNSAGLQLIDYDSWNSDRPGDREWQAQIIEKLRDRAEASHIEHVQREVGSVRYRPEEVAAGAALAPPAAGFAEACVLAEQILDLL